MQTLITLFLTLLTKFYFTFFSTFWAYTISTISISIIFNNCFFIYNF